MIQQILVTPHYPNQQVNFTANKQNITMSLYFRGYIGLPEVTQSFINTYAPPRFYADIYLNNDLLIAGTPVIDRTPINLYPSILKGVVMSVDSKGNSDPTLDNLGDTVLFYYLDTLDELSNLASLII